MRYVSGVRMVGVIWSMLRNRLMVAVMRVGYMANCRGMRCI